MCHLCDMCNNYSYETFQVKHSYFKVEIYIFKVDRTDRKIENIFLRVECHEKVRNENWLSNYINVETVNV